MEGGAIFQEGDGAFLYSELCAAGRAADATDGRPARPPLPLQITDSPSLPPPGTEANNKLLQAGVMPLAEPHSQLPPPHEKCQHFVADFCAAVGQTHVALYLTSCQPPPNIDNISYPFHFRYFFLYYYVLCWTRPLLSPFIFKKIYIQENSIYFLNL